MESEIVLPSGKFARFRPIIALDILMAVGVEHIHALLISRIVTIDDESLTYEEVLQMPAEEFVPLLGRMNEMMSKVKLKGML